MKKIAFNLAMVALAMVACDNSKELVLSPANLTIHAAEEQQLEAVGENSDLVSWTTANEFVAKVTPQGVVVGNHVGSTTILAKLGEKGGTCAVNVAPKYNTYVEPITKWGLTMDEVIAQKGSPNEKGDGYLLYVQDKKNGIKEEYYFEEGLLYVVYITLFANSNTPSFLSERYHCIDNDGDGNIYINALTKKDATLAIYYTNDIMDGKQVDVIVYQSTKLIE